MYGEQKTITDNTYKYGSYICGNSYMANIKNGDFTVQYCIFLVI